MAYEDFADLANRQSFQSQNSGNLAAQLADPFGKERWDYQNQLKKLMQNPGDFASSPVYQFAYNQGLDALDRKANAQGLYNSGNRLAALQDYGQKSASQLFYPQANLLAKLSGADNGSPAAAGLAYSGAFNRGQDQQSMALAARGAGQQQNYLNDLISRFGQNSGNTGNYGGYGSNSALPSGGAMPYYGGYNGGFQQPSQGAGTGYLSDDAGMTTFGGGGYNFSPNLGGAGFDESYAPANYDGYGDYGSYDLGSGDFGDSYGDYADYGDF